ncbi:hypothetical protein PPNSA23_39540 [Phyllobacterium phragmitis]|uniref:Uncharacterized protein n=1 Tax=Phyllobacterium phragmitis TaxID=2670329 RepID=A0ABQ0H530_9HYPH
MGTEAEFRPGDDEAHEPAAVGKQPARQIVDLVSELGRRPHHLLARISRDAGAWSEGPGYGRARDAGKPGDLLGADEAAWRGFFLYQWISQWPTFDRTSDFRKRSTTSMKPTEGMRSSSAVIDAT